MNPDDLTKLPALKNTRQIEIHPSGLLLAWNCLQSILGKYKVGNTSDPSNVGTAVHEAIPLMIRDVKPDLHWIAEKYNVVDFDDMQKMYAYGHVAWREKGLKEKFLPGNFIKLEHKLEYQLTDNVKIVGTADLSWTYDQVTKILDWKSGRVKRNPWKQLLCYLLLNLESMRFNTDDSELRNFDFWGIVAWLRYWEYESKRFTYDQIMEFKDQLIEKVSQPDPEYVRNEECEYCPRYLTDCPIIPAETRNIALAVADIENFDFYTHADKVPEIDAKVKILTNLCNKWKKLRDARLRQGPIELPDNQQMVLEAITKRHISDNRKAKDITLDHLSESETWECLSFSLTQAEKQIRSNAQKGQGASLVRSFNRDLEEAGIISKVPFRSIPKIIQKELENGKQ